MVEVYSMYSKICLCKCMWAWGQSHKGKAGRERRTSRVAITVQSLWVCTTYVGKQVFCRLPALSVLKTILVGISLGKLNQVYAWRITDESQKNLEDTTDIHWYPLISTDIHLCEGCLGLVPQAAPELLKMTSVAQGWSISYHSTSLCEKVGSTTIWNGKLQMERQMEHRNLIPVIPLT